MDLSILKSEIQFIRVKDFRGGVLKGRKKTKHQVEIEIPSGKINASAHDQKRPGVRLRCRMRILTGASSSGQGQPGDEGRLLHDLREVRRVPGHHHVRVHVRDPFHRLEGRRG